MKAARRSVERMGGGDDEAFGEPLLGEDEERALLRGLADCRRKLAEALARADGPVPADGADDPVALADYWAGHRAGDGPEEARLGAIARRAALIRKRLALANMRLVAHVARRYRDRGVAYADLLQEGFCGLLEAIDRFDLSHGTRLATYATWWVRQSVQKAVASGAYPVRLTPRHLRQLARSQGGETSEQVRRIDAATRPAVPIDANGPGAERFGRLQATDAPEAAERGEAVGRLLEAIGPREREVIALRFGLGGKERHSLSQVGRALGVSKERARQIQERAMEKLRAEAEGRGMGAPDDGRPEVATRGRPISRTER